MVDIIIFYRPISSRTPACNKNQGLLITLPIISLLSSIAALITIPCSIIVLGVSSKFGTIIEYSISTPPLLIGGADHALPLRISGLAVRISADSCWNTWRRGQRGIGQVRPDGFPLLSRRRRWRCAFSSVNPSSDQLLVAKEAPRPPGSPPCMQPGARYAENRLIGPLAPSS
ncbi:hypothetical protein GQ44DRAFT_503245 [Phaeosphaeriaceae sp. PMI808]|nr:hypothetical protein GQ44DRAFT_503245 [Phaeosphaeriaceae sp. PMI808]